LPDSATISVTHALTPVLTLVSDVVWTHWSTFQDLTIRRPDTSIIGSTPFRHQDTVFAAVGAIYRIGEDWAFRSGIAYDQSPVKNEFRSVRLPDQDRYIAAVGIGYSVNDALSFDAGYLHFFLPNGGMTTSANAASPTGDTIQGSFRLHADEVALSAHLRF
jgi:long-chain fatty acid transport protein